MGPRVQIGGSQLDTSNPPPPKGGYAFRFFGLAALAASRLERDWVFWRVPRVAALVCTRHGHRLGIIINFPHRHPMHVLMY